MEIKVVEQNENKLIIKIEGSGHTICNILKNELKNDSNVNIVAYKIDHPLIGVPQIHIETNGKITPEAAIKKALKKISSDADKLKKSIMKEIK